MEFNNIILANSKLAGYASNRNPEKAEFICFDHYFKESEKDLIHWVSCISPKYNVRVLESDKDMASKCVKCEREALD